MGSEFGVTATTKPQVRLDGVGIFWVSWAGAWTALVVAGMVFLFMKRHLPFLAIRGLPLTFGAVILLHLYWISVQLGYVVGPIAPEVAEYWIMGVWFPFGIGLFQAANTQLLHVAKIQKRYVHMGSISDATLDEKLQEKLAPAPGFRRVVKQFQQISYSMRVLITVSIGLFIQVRLNVVI